MAERLDIEQATMANTLARMERDGLIQREKDEALAALSPEEQGKFLELMRRIIVAR